MPLWATMVLTANSTRAAVARGGAVVAVRLSFLKIKFMLYYIASHCLRQEVANRTPVVHHIPDAGARDIHQGGLLENHPVTGRMLKATPRVERPEEGVDFPEEHFL
jgi:hypothetical protein